MNPQALPTADQIERALAGVFARPEFVPREPSLLARLFQRAWDALTGLLARLVAGLDPSNTPLPVLWAVIGVLAAAAAVLAVRFGGVALRAWRARDRSAGRPADAAVASGGPGADEWEARAGRAAARGDWRGAALALYQALLLHLDAAGAVRYDPSKTPGDYRREARRHPRAFRALDAFLGPFEPVAFGGRAIDAPGYARLQSTVQEAAARG
ncbi:MAG TPA: DUF4129 domain-containing protein [Longimicrobiales bacterium]